MVMSGDKQITQERPTVSVSSGAIKAKPFVVSGNGGVECRPNPTTTSRPFITTTSYSYREKVGNLERNNAAKIHFHHHHCQEHAAAMAFLSRIITARSPSSLLSPLSLLSFFTLAVLLLLQVCIDTYMHMVCGCAIML